MVPMARQGCAELETSPAAALLGQRADSPRCLTWGPGSWAGWGQPREAEQEQERLGLPSGPRHQDCMVQTQDEGSHTPASVTSSVPLVGS